MKKLGLLILITLILLPFSVKANTYYVNKNGIKFSKQEYEYIVNLFDDEFIDIMNTNDYNYLLDKSYTNRNLKSSQSSDIMPLASSEHTTNSKSLKIVSSCNTSNCNIAVSLKWLKNPIVKSYDVIGAYLEGTSLLDNPTTYISSSNGQVNSNEIIKQANGFGVSVQLTMQMKDINVYQYYTVSSKGTIYASYQHAAKKYIHSE